MQPHLVEGSQQRKAPENSPAAMLAHLEAVLGSRAFSGAWRQQRLLRFLVEKYVQGQTAELKEYCLGVEVFDKGETFDPRLDPIVRVEVSRLRSRLEKYYEGEGREQSLRIVLPKGSYVPQIVARVNGPHAETEAGQSRAAVSQRRREAPRRGWLLWAAPAALAALAWAAIQGISASRRSAVPAYEFSRVTREAARCSFPSLSPDGKHCVYARMEGGQWDLYLRSFETEQAVNLTADSPADDWQAAFSPDGSRIVFRSERDGGGIFLMGSRGGPATRLAGFGYHPSWSPDGRRVVFSSGTFFEPEDGPARRASELFVADALTGEVEQVTSAAQVYDAVQPKWSPHGHRIAFWASGPEGRRDLWTIPASGSAAGGARATPVTQDAWLDWNPSWSPDGRYLYFTSDRDGSMNIWRVRIEEQTGRVMDDPEPVRTPSVYSTHFWMARDGQGFVYTRRSISSMLYVAPFRLFEPVDTSAARQVTAPGRQVREPEFSPDGAWLAARIQDPEEDIVIMRPDGTQMRRLTNDKAKDRNARWSPDGKHLLFISNRGGKFETWTVHVDGSSLRRVAPSMTLIWDPGKNLVAFPEGAEAFCLAASSNPCPAVSLPQDFAPMVFAPDGRLVAGRLRTAPPPREQLYVYSPGDGSYHKITDHGWSPVWLKNSRHLLYWEENTIWLSRADGQDKRAVLQLPGQILQQRFTLTPDQRLIYFVRTEIEEDVWLARRR